MFLDVVSEAGSAVLLTLIENMCSKCFYTLASRKIGRDTARQLCTDLKSRGAVADWDFGACILARVFSIAAQNRLDGMNDPYIAAETVGLVDNVLHKESA
jgi:hypothetical protein